MSSSNLFIIQSKNDQHFKRRLELSKDETTIAVPGKAGAITKIRLKMKDGKPTWSELDGSRFKVRFNSSPVQLTQVVYPKTQIPRSKSISDDSNQKLQYFIIDKRSGGIVSTKIFNKKRGFSEKQYLKEFGISFDKKIHEMKVRPISESFSPVFTKDEYSNDYAELIQDRRLRIFLSVLLSLWILSHGYDYVKDFFKKEEITKIQIENNKKIIKEKEKIAKLLETETKPTDIITNSNDNKPLKSKAFLKRKSKNKKAFSAKKTTKKPLKKGKNTTAATRKTIAKKKSKPSLQDQLFSRSLVKGSTGKASNSAKKTLRGSSKGTKSGKGYGGAGSIKGGFVKGTGKSFGSKLGNRGGSGGGSYDTGGNGSGGLGAGLSLNGQGAGVSGGLTREQINKIVRRNKKDISRCFETREQFSPGLSGQVSMNFTINSLGRVAAASAGASTIADSALKKCLSRKIANWKFDKPTGGRLVKVSYPFNFKSTRGKF